MPQTYVEDGYRLGQWVSVQRTAYTKGKLASDSVARLEALPGWSWHAREHIWEEGLEYLAALPHARVMLHVLQTYVKDGYRLGEWVARQRAAYTKGQLTADRIGRLEAVPGWSWNTRTDSWKEGFGYLCRFVEREGHARVPQDHAEDGYRLGQWVSGQRIAHARAQLDADRAAHLEELDGWTWEVLTEQWEEGFRYLCQFVEREGHARVTKGYLEGGYRLGHGSVCSGEGTRQGGSLPTGSSGSKHSPAGAGTRKWSWVPPQGKRRALARSSICLAAYTDLLHVD